MLNLNGPLHYCTTIFGDLVHPLYSPDQSWPLDWTEQFKEWSE